MRLPRPRIAVVDSGVGGLSILASIAERLPHADFHYCADNANFPYGPKPEELVVDCVCRASHALVERSRPHLLVVACGTASTAALPRLRAELGIPVIGVVPAIKPAAALSKTKTIGLLATPGTVRRPYTDDLIGKFASDCRVIRVGTARLVELAEDKLRGGKIPEDEIFGEISALFPDDDTHSSARVDVVVMGCTHFPLLRDEMAALAKWPVAWLDSGAAVADRTVVVAREIGLETENAEIGGMRSAFFTLDWNWRELVPGLKAMGFSAFEVL